MRLSKVSGNSSRGTRETFYISYMDHTDNYPPFFLHRLPLLAKPPLRLAR